MGGRVEWAGGVSGRGGGVGEEGWEGGVSGQEGGMGGAVGGFGWGGDGRGGEWRCEWEGGSLMARIGVSEVRRYSQEEVVLVWMLFTPFVYMGCIQLCFIIFVHPP